MMLNFNTDTNTMNLITEAPSLALSLAVGAVLVVGLLIVLENRKVD